MLCENKRNSENLSGMSLHFAPAAEATKTYHPNSLHNNYLIATIDVVESIP